jgi:hypothetical protein
MVGVRDTPEDAAYTAMVDEFSEAFLGPTASEAVQRLDAAFGNDVGSLHSLHSLFRDQQRTILELILRPLVAEAEAAHLRLYVHNAELMRLLTDLQIPLPKTFRASAEFALNHLLLKEFLGDEPNVQRVAPLIEQAKAVNVSLDVPMLEYALRTRLEQMAEGLLAGAADPLLRARFLAAVDLARDLPFQVTLWHVQNLFYEQLQCLARQSQAGIQQALEAIVAGELARLGEALLFTPQALDDLLSIEHRAT